MTSAPDVDRLYRLLPAIHRLRDADEGYPLRALLGLIGREAQVIEDDLWRLYDSWFIETCPDWVVPYIGELIGFVPGPRAGDSASLDVSSPGTGTTVLIPRRDVANTIHDRRRKGTLALLEAVARDTAGWPAHAVELFRQLARAQYLNALHLGRGGTANLRRGLPLTRLDGPFNDVAHTVDVRRPDSTQTTGRYNIPSVALFAWRLRAYTVTHCQADCVEDIGPQCYTFSALGNDTELFNPPQPGAGPVPGSRPLDLPVPITRRLLEDRTRTGSGNAPAIHSVASGDYYGLDKSVAIWAPDWPVKGAPQPVPRESILPADLTGWQYQTPLNYIALDPELGRFTFPPRQLPKGSVYVSYAYGFNAPIGGGEYDRPLLESEGAIVYRVGRAQADADDSIQAAVRRWRSSSPRQKAAVIEILDSGVYTEPLGIELDRDESLQIRAANRARPVLRLLDYVVDRPDPFSVRGRRGSRFTLDGLLVTGRGLAIYGADAQDGGESDDDLCEVVIRHCTLVPGWGLRNDCEPLRPAEPSIEILGSQARLRIEHSIVGSIVVAVSQVRVQPLEIALSDSVLDATGHDCARPDCEALTAPGGAVAHAAATFRRCTVFGRVHTHAISLAENSIFTGVVRVARKQAGCIRFCYLPPGSRTPPRYSCQPDRATAGLSGPASAAAATRVRPQFMSTRYGTADYARLADDGPDEIREGADDQSEMGVYHDLYEPQRAGLLRQRLAEFTPAGMDAGLFLIR